jgi:hypothetical protein
MFVSIVFLLVLLSSGTLAWCGILGGCKLGKYRAKATLTDAKTQEPLANMELTPTINSGSPPIARNREEGQPVMTDNEGQASLEFNRVFYGQLVIVAVSDTPETRALFGFNPQEIKAHTTLSQTDLQYFIYAKERGKIRLVLEVGDWSLF